MPFLTRHAVCFLLAEVLVISGERLSFAEDEVFSLRATTAPRLLDQHFATVQPCSRSFSGKFDSRPPGSADWP